MGVIPQKITSEQIVSAMSVYEGNAEDFSKVLLIESIVHPLILKQNKQGSEKQNAGRKGKNRRK